MTIPNSQFPIPNSQFFSRMGVVAVTEVRHTLRQGSYYAATVITVLLFVAAGVLPRLRAAAADSPLASVEGMLSSEQPPITQPTAVVDDAQVLVNIPPEHTGLVVVDKATAEAGMREGVFGRYYHIPADFLASGEIAVYSEYNQLLSTTNATLAQMVQSNVRQQIEPIYLAERLSNPAEFAWGDQPEPPTLRFVPTEIPEAQLNIALLVVGLFTFMLNNSGFLLLQAFEREREARTMEVMLTSTTQGQLLAGKLVALSFLSLAQVGLALGVGAAVYGQPDGVAAFPTAAILTSLPFLVLGYLLYSGFILGVGLLLPSTTSSAQAQLVLRVLVLSPLAGAYLMLLDVDGTAAVVFSLFPLTAHVLMPLRLLLTAVPWWEMALSFLLLLGFTGWLLGRVARLKMLTY